MAAGDCDEVLDQVGIEALAARIASTMRAGDVVLLSGPLGAGKTTFARALIRAVCGGPGMEVPSPSYTLVQSYDAAGYVLHHYDLWRLDGPGGLGELGWEDARAGVVVVEWPERLGAMRPEGVLEISLAFAAGERRTVKVRDRRGERVSSPGLHGQDGR